MIDTPNPGSRAAKAQGCLCPVLDNRHGAGAFTDEHGSPVFYLTEGCPLHSDRCTCAPSPSSDLPKEDQ